ncbi:hypothetical protein DsansV1_C09g0093211 [Dioscorea sansibarensis]
MLLIKPGVGMRKHCPNVESAISVRGCSGLTPTQDTLTQLKMLGS